MDAIIEAVLATTRRAFILVDNSRSVLKQDAATIVCDDPGVDSSLTGAVFRVEESTRWSEMMAAITSMALAADQAGVKTEILLLNKQPEPFTIGNGSGSNSDAAARVADLLATKPQGLTPLCAQLKGVAAQLVGDAPKSTYSSKTALLVIFVDGESTDGDVLELLRPLIALRFRLVIRLCTTEGEVVAYWRDIAAQLMRAAPSPGMTVTVIGTHVSVAAAVARLNPWLTYGEALHRAREWGAAIPGIDDADTRPLRPEEARACVETLLGLRARPATTGSAADWRIFVASARSSLDLGKGLKRWFCAARKQLLPCVDVEELAKMTPPDALADEPPQTPLSRAPATPAEPSSTPSLTAAAAAPTPLAPATPATPATPLFATPLPYHTPAPQSHGPHLQSARDLMSPLTPGKMQAEMDLAELQALRQHVGRKDASDASKGACDAYRPV